MAEKFKDKSIEEFASALSSAAPTPGGGAAAALASALGASLVMMVANHTIGKSGYAEFEELNRDILAEAKVLRDRLLAGMDTDAEAFGALMEAYSLPKGGARDGAMLEGAAKATEAPLAVMEDSLALMRLAATMKGRSNKSLESDLVTAMHFLRAAIMSENCNVAANLPEIEKGDAGLASKLRERAAAVVAEAEGLTADLI